MEPRVPPLPPPSLLYPPHPRPDSKDFQDQDPFLKKRVKPSMRPVECPECGKKFDKFYLKAHLSNFHNGVRHECNLCDSTFAFKGSLQRHINNIHLKIVPKNAQTFACPDCGREFNRRDVMTRHMDVVHDGLKRYPCSLCDRGFSHKDDMQYHTVTVHKNFRFKNKAEWKQFFEDSELEFEKFFEVHNTQVKDGEQHFSETEVVPIECDVKLEETSDHPSLSKKKHKSKKKRRQRQEIHDQPEVKRRKDLKIEVSVTKFEEAELDKLLDEYDEGCSEIENQNRSFEELKVTPSELRKFQN